MKKKGKFLVITATLVPEAEEVEDKEVEKVTIPWVKEILKVTISDYLLEN